MELCTLQVSNIYQCGLICVISFFFTWKSVYQRQGGIEAGSVGVWVEILVGGTNVVKWSKSSHGSSVRAGVLGTPEVHVSEPLTMWARRHRSVNHSRVTILHRPLTKFESGSEPIPFSVFEICGYREPLTRVPIWVSMTIASRMDILFSKSREPGFQSPNGSTCGPYPELTFVITRASSIVATSLNWAYTRLSWQWMHLLIKRPLPGWIEQHTTCAETLKRAISKSCKDLRREQNWSCMIISRRPL